VFFRRTGDWVEWKAVPGSEAMTEAPSQLKKRTGKTPPPRFGHCGFDGRSCNGGGGYCGGCYFGGSSGQLLRRRPRSRCEWGHGNQRWSDSDVQTAGGAQLMAVTQEVKSEALETKTSLSGEMPVTGSQYIR
jgi:hypothetical protein